MSSVRAMPEVEPEEAQLDPASIEMWEIVIRRQQLLSRQTVLLEMQQFLKNCSTDRRAEEETEEDEGPSELDRVEKELQSLSEREKDLVNRRLLWENQTITVGATDNSSVTEPDSITPVKRKDLIISGVCVLPNVTARHSHITMSTSSDKEVSSTGPSPDSSEDVEEVQDLSFSPAVIHCPNCQKDITTEVHYKVGKSSFIICFLSVFFGCVAGCCLLPFFLNYFKDVSHRCPSCNTEIQTIQRL